MKETKGYESKKNDSKAIHQDWMMFVSPQALFKL